MRVAASFRHPASTTPLLALAQDPSHKSRADRTRLGDFMLVLIELGVCFGFEN
jgi:hypothetical protein